MSHHTAAASPVFHINTLRLNEALAPILPIASRNTQAPLNHVSISNLNGKHFTISGTNYDVYVTTTIPVSWMEDCEPATYGSLTVDTAVLNNILKHANEDDHITLSLSTTEKPIVSKTKVKLTTEKSTDTDSTPAEIAAQSADDQSADTTDQIAADIGTTTQVPCVLLKAGASTYTLHTLPTAAIIAPVTVGEMDTDVLSITFGAESFFRHIKSIAFAQSSDPMRKILNGVCFEFEPLNLKATMIACDGTRLARTHTDLSCCTYRDATGTTIQWNVNDKPSFVVESATINFLLKAITEHTTHIHFRYHPDSTRLTIVLVTKDSTACITCPAPAEGYPAWRQVEPDLQKEHSYFRFTQSGLIEAIKAASVVATDKSRAIDIEFCRNKYHATFQCYSDQHGLCSSTADYSSYWHPTTRDMDTITIRFDYGKLMEIIKQCQSPKTKDDDDTQDTITIWIEEPTFAASIEWNAILNWKTIIMPMIQRKAEPEPATTATTEDKIDATKAA